LVHSYDSSFLFIPVFPFCFPPFNLLPILYGILSR
jgi:hypothetical protein